MARLDVRTIPPLPVKPVEEFVLTLSRDEAETLLAIVGRITGSDTKSRRKHTNAIYRVLYPVLGFSNTSDVDLEKTNFFFKNREDINA